MFTVTTPAGQNIQHPDAKGYRVSKHTGLLTIWGRRFATIAAYPKGAWAYISEAPDAQ